MSFIKFYSISIPMSIALKWSKNQQSNEIRKIISSKSTRCGGEKRLCGRFLNCWEVVCFTHYNLRFFYKFLMGKFIQPSYNFLSKFALVIIKRGTSLTLYQLGQLSFIGRSVLPWHTIFYFSFPYQAVMPFFMLTQTACQVSRNSELT